MTDKEKFEGFKQQMIDENEQKYGQEIREKYGDETVNASHAKMMKMTAEEYAAFEALGKKLNETLVAALATADAASPLAQEAAALHKQWLCATWPHYSTEAHKNLADMYVADERFTAYYDAIAPGAAPLLRDAIHIYCDKQGQASLCW